MTIAALATAPAPGAVGIIRVSGPATGRLVDTLFTQTLRPWPGYAAVPNQTLHYGTLRTPAGDAVDRILLLVMRAPHSYTGEDVAEFHCHGGPAAVGGVLDAVFAAGARAAAPGEFTRRAYHNGKLDLTRAEAVAALTAARSGEALRLAAAAERGVLSEWLREVKHDLDELRVALTYEIDLDEEGAAGERAPWRERVAARQRELTEVLRRGEANLRALAGATVALVGPANAGKSSLFNRLLGEERAIVTDVPGTTRDPVRGDAVLGGVPVTFLDTAGWGDAADAIAAAAADRRGRAVGSAALALVVLDGSAPCPAELAARLDELPALPRLVALNKSDLGSRWDAADRRDYDVATPVSARTGAGVAELTALLAERLGAGGLEPERPGAVSARQQSVLRRAGDDLARLAAALAADAGAELLLVEVRTAQRTIGELLGEQTPAAVLDEIFSRFCIGK